MTQEERDARTERFKQFVNRHAVSMSKAALISLREHGPGSLLLRVADLPGGDAFTAETFTTEFCSKARLRAKVKDDPYYADWLKMVSRHNPATEMVVFAEYEDGCDFGRHLMIRDAGDVNSHAENVKTPRRCSPGASVAQAPPRRFNSAP